MGALLVAAMLLFYRQRPSETSCRSQDFRSDCARRQCYGSGRSSLSSELERNMASYVSFDILRSVRRNTESKWTQDREDRFKARLNADKERRKPLRKEGI